MVKYLTKRTYRGKVGLMDYDALLAMDDGTCLYCLSSRDVMLLLSNIEPLQWKKRYFSNSGTTIDKDVIEAWYVHLQEALMANVCAEINGKLDYIKDKTDAIMAELIEFRADETQSDILTDLAIAAIATDLATLSAAVALDSAAIAGIALQTTAIQIDLANTHTQVDNIYDIVSELNCEAQVINFEIINNFTDNTQIQIILDWLAAPPPEAPGKAWLLKEGDTDVTQYRRWCALVKTCFQWVKSTAYRLVYQLDVEWAGLGGLWTDLATIGGYLVGTYFDSGTTAGLPSVTDVETAIANETAITNVVCALANALALVPVSFTSWYDTINGLTAAPDTDEEILVNLLKAVSGADVTLQYNYQGFLRGLATALIDSAADTPDAWSCNGCTLNIGCETTVWDFTQEVTIPWVIAKGQVSFGEGIVGVIAAPDSAPSIILQLDFPDGCELTNVNMVVNRGGGATSLPAYLEQWKDVGGVLTLHARSALTNSTNGTDQSVTITPTAGTVIKRLVFYTNSNYMGAIKGTGVPANTAQWYIVRSITVNV